MRAGIGAAWESRAIRRIYMRSICPASRRHLEFLRAQAFQWHPPQRAVTTQGVGPMVDFIFLGLGVIGFALMLVYVRICQNL